MKLIQSLRFASNGLKACFRSQANFRIHVLMGSMAILLGGVLHISTGEWLTLLLCIGSVLILEMINTSLERLCDLVEKNHHPEIKYIKDLAAGAVLVSAAVSLSIGTIIFFPKIITFMLSL